ncbi:hypothetical protein [Agromyces sp. CCNWLW203]|uniref:hypothetical protein n=1 Tax=Agromyces sp. CCNWLW203 TaxID=3112842 RepID=UPI002F96D62A
MTEASASPGRAAADDDGSVARSATPFWLAITIAVLFGVFYAYDVWEAVGNLVGMNVTAGELGVAITGAGWALLLAGIAVPLLVFGAAFWLGRRRSPLVQVVLYLAGYALVQVLAADFASFGLAVLDLS